MKRGEQKNIYLDYAASTPVAPEVMRAMRPYFLDYFGNPGSLHAYGQKAIAAIDLSREIVANTLGAEFREVLFMGSATEANNYIVQGVVRQYQKDHEAISVHPPRIIISSIEHESIRETANTLARGGIDVVVLPVDRKGRVQMREFERALNDHVALVSVMYANNETGTIEPIQKIGAVIQEFRARRLKKYPHFHTDAVQALQFLDCNVINLGIDSMTLSGHKIYGPKGIGVLYLRKEKQSNKSLGAAPIPPLLYGGGQEFLLRSGTENVPSIVGFAKALALVTHTKTEEASRIERLRGDFLRAMKKIDSEIVVHGGGEGETLPSIVSLHIPGYRAEDLLVALDHRGIAVSAGSACTARAAEPSYVLQAMGYSRAHAAESIRISFGRPTTKKDIDNTVAIFKIILKK